MTPVRPPNRNVTRKPMANSIGVSKDRCPRHIVPIQLKNFTPVGTAIRNVMKREERQQHLPGGEHVVRPHRHRQAGDGDGRADQADVAEHRLAAEDRDDLGDDAEERQRDDVDLGMAEEPEQVLPEHRRRRCSGRRCARRTCGRPPARAARRPAPGRPSAPGSTVSRTFQVKIGIRNMVMPGARMQMIVVMKLTEPRIVPRPGQRQAHDPQVAADAGRVDRRWTAARRPSSRSRPRRPG